MPLRHLDHLILHGAGIGIDIDAWQRHFRMNGQE
jgi:hypothetical protein